MKHFEQKVIRFIDEKNLINKNDKILVALSGGPDSVLLLNLLVKYQKRFKINIGALHINHRLRGVDSREDERFCRLLCESLNVTFYSVRKNVKSYSQKYKYSLEESGRILRYYELNRFADKYGYNKIATAHNSSDNAETVLLNLIKGAGLRGISGIPYKRGNIIRPVLCVTKKEINSYLKFHKINFRVDLTNLSSDYERNFLRNEILPVIKKRLNPSIEDTILNSSEIFRNADCLIECKVNEFIDDVADFSGKELKIYLNKLPELKPELIPELLKTLLKKNFQMQVTFDDILKLKSLINKESGKNVNLSSNISALKERNVILIGPYIRDENFQPVNTEVGKEVQINGKKLCIENCERPIKFSNKKNEEYIPADNIDDKFIIRRWQYGDRFYPLGLNGTKKVSDFLNEEKIASSQKKKQLVLLNNDKIVWIIGLRLDERFKITNKTNRIFKLCLR
ncbi:MAG TPA: tRNA lysidine(34) synthetase TilS [Ignavibacteria bacterium]|nr:tRNA lysidine(34) synthetase TilS [Ignavibacteria bacterium]